jgi:hypothetical protein
MGTPISSTLLPRYFAVSRQHLVEYWHVLAASTYTNTRPFDRQSTSSDVARLAWTLSHPKAHETRQWKLWDQGRYIASICYASCCFSRHSWSGIGHIRCLYGIESSLCSRHADYVPTSSSFTMATTLQKSVMERCRASLLSKKNCWMLEAHLQQSGGISSCGRTF